MTGFTAFNGLFSGDTHENTTFFADLSGNDSSGLLRDIESGADTQVLLSTSAVGVNFGGNGSQPASGTDARDIFSGFVDFSAGDRKSIEISGNDVYQYTFENLDSGATYEFAGTAIRGNAGYTNRWTLVEIGGADSFSASHSSGTGVITSGLQPHQVAIWTGNNADSGQGFVAEWVDIDPGDDGVFFVTSKQYTGSVPRSIDSGGSADGNKGYGIAGIRLKENVPAGPPAVDNVAATNVLAFGAELGGNIVTTGGLAPEVKIYYGTSDGGTNAASWQNVVDLGSASRDFSVVLDGLNQNTTYHFRSYAEQALGGAWAPATESFTTLTAGPPAIQNLPATSVGAFSAVANGQVIDTGNDTPIVTVYYGDNNGGTNVGAWDHSIEVGVQNGIFSTPLSELEPLSQYYFTTRAQNTLGQSWATPPQSFSTSDTPPLQINEFMSDNATTMRTRVRDDINQSFRGDRLTPDWIEIHNPTDVATDLGGFHLTDDLDNDKMWEFPAGSLIPAGGYLVVFASGLDVRDGRLDENGYLHANFQLGGDAGDDISLTDASGDAVFTLSNTPLQSEDVSYGIDAAGSERFFNVPTPGESNANDVPKAPVVSVPSQTFTDSLVVELTPALPTHTIRYTLNERTPTASSTRYTGPMTISSTSQLRAVSVAPNGKVSAVVSRTYIETASSVLDDDSNLPLMIVETFGDGIPGRGSNFGDAFVAIIEPGQDGRTTVSQPFDLETRAGIHVRGSSSAGFSKKQYRVEFWDEQNEDQKQEVLGMPKEADWIFYGPSQFDRVLISNPLMFDLSNQIGRYATRTRYVEMYLNNGGSLSSSDYVGVYAITEVIEQGDDRVDVEELTTGAGGLPVEGGFIWKNDRGSAYVDPESTTSAQRRHIDGWINDLRSAAASRDFKDPVKGYEAYADVGSFIDHNILNLLAMNVDALRLSSFYFKTDDGKLEAGPIWDFDRSLDSTDGRDNNPRTWFGSGDSTRYFNDNDRVMSWWSDMFRDPDFVQQYIDRWFELRQNEFSLENINATIDAHAAQISEAAARDYRRWSGSRYRDFAGEITQLKGWLRQRVEWIDSRWLDPPEFDQANSQVAPGTPVTLSSDTGQIYYTLDGSDPRGEDGAIRPEAKLANGPISIDGFTRITSRVYEDNHGSNNGYVRSGDDWSAPSVGIFYIDPPATIGNLAITEVMYNPSDPISTEQAAGFDDNDDFEFIELTNVGATNVVLTGTRLAKVDRDGDEEGVAFNFTSSDISTLAPGERILVVEDVDAFETRYGNNLPVAGQWSGGLDNNRETITLLAFDDSVIQQFRYNDGGGWTSRPDGDGSSLEVVDPAGDDNDPDNWQASVDFGGSPGTVSSGPVGVLINEVLAHTDPPLTPSDSIELFNTTSSTINIGGWYLSDSINEPLKFRIPAGTQLAPGAYIVFDESDFNPNPMNPGSPDFALSSARGDDVWLVIPDGNGGIAKFVDDVHFPATPNGESMGRVPNGTGPLMPMTQRTLGGENGEPRVGPVIISELNYAPGNPSINALVLDQDLTSDDLEFVEIFNPTATAVDLTEWRIRGGVDLNFDPGTQLPAGGTLVVLSFNPAKPENSDRTAAFRAHYAINASVRLAGGYDGKLSDAGESVRLERPDDPPAEDPALIPRLWEDVVSYDVEAPWPDANGTGQSLTRVSPTSYGRSAVSWVAAKPSPGANGTGETLGDVNDDGVVNSDDIDLVCGNLGSADLRFDLNGDGLVNRADTDALVRGILGTVEGDANADGVFDSTDLIQVFQRGEYEDDLANNSVWSDGDWNCDGEFDSGDLVAAFQAGGYTSGARAGDDAARDKLFSEVR